MDTQIDIQLSNAYVYKSVHDISLYIDKLLKLPVNMCHMQI